MLTISLNFQDNHISDKICLECFDKFKGISQFYAQCKNSKSKYTPCFRDSSTRLETPRILSTETPDLVSTSELKKRDPSSDLFSSSSSSRSIQSCVSPKTKYLLHHDLGIRLPKQPQRDSHCFGETDPCYSLLRKEFDEQNGSKDEEHLEKNKGRKSNFPPLTHRDDRPLMQDMKRHTHVANCPFCPALILKKHSSF